MNEESTHFAQEGETKNVKQEGNTDVEADATGTARVAEGLPWRESKERAENFSVMPVVSEKSKEKMLDNIEQTEIAAGRDTKDVKLQENMQLENNTATPQKADQEDASKPEVQPVLKTVEISELIENSSESAKDNSSKVLFPEIHKESHAQENIERKDSKVNSTITSAAPLVDNVTTGESQELREFVVSEDKQIQAINETNEDHKKVENVAKVDTNTLSLLEHVTPHYSPNESTCTTRKDMKVINLEKQEDDAEKASILVTGTSKHEQMNTLEKREKNLIIEIESTQEVKGKAQGRGSEDEEKQQMVEEQAQFSTGTTEINLYKKDILTRNEDRTIHNEDENSDKELLELEPTTKELQVENEDLQDSFDFVVAPEAKGLKHEAEDRKSIDECRETPESEVKEVPRHKILPEAEAEAEAKARENQDPFDDSCIKTGSVLELKGKTDHITNSGTEPSCGDEKLQLLQQGPEVKIFQPAIEILEGTDASNLEGGAKEEENVEIVKIIANSQSTAEKFGSTTLAESSQSDLQRPTKERQQQQGVGKAQDRDQNLHVLSDINSSALVIDIKGDPICSASVNDTSVPLELKRLDKFPFPDVRESSPEGGDTNNTTDSKNMQPQQEATMKICETVAENLEPSKVNSKEATHREEKGTHEAAILASVLRESCSTSLSDLLRESNKGVSLATCDFPSETEPNTEKEEMNDLKTEGAQHKEREGDEDNRTELAYESPVTVEASSDIDIRAAHKKSHNMLSGVGSKVKKSFKRVKKAITGKSCHYCEAC